MYIIITCKYDKDLIKNNRVKVATPFSKLYNYLLPWKHQFFRRLRAAYSVVRGQIWPNFELIQAFMHVLIACKYEKDQMINSGENVK